MQENLVTGNCLGQISIYFDIQIKIKIEVSNKEKQMCKFLSVILQRCKNKNKLSSIRFFIINTFGIRIMTISSAWFQSRMLKNFSTIRPETCPTYLYFLLILVAELPSTGHTRSSNLLSLVDTNNQLTTFITQ